MAAEPSLLSSAAVNVIDDQANTLLLSDVSVWEVCVKWQSGKLKLPTPARSWCETQVATWKTEPLQIKRAHLYRVTELPVHHKDPFDRLLVAQGLEEQLTLVTPDSHIAQYPVSVVW